MQSNAMLPLNFSSGVGLGLKKSSPPSDYTEYICPEYIAKHREIEQEFVQLLYTENLDQQVQAHPHIVEQFEAALSVALNSAYRNHHDGKNTNRNRVDDSSDNDFGNDSDHEAAHRFIQRILYRINRLNLFWYDDLNHYTNERSIYLANIRDRIEAIWQAWELAQIDVAALRQIEVRQALIDRSAVDLNPPLSDEARFIREEMSQAGYCHLLKIASFDGLVEASRLSRILGGAANEVQCMLVRVLLEEYGAGKLSRKHSTFFAQMMAELGLRTEPEGYFDLVPWQVLASINHNFLLTERKRHFLRYNGGLTYFEIAGPSIYRNYMTAAQRLQLSNTAMSYWELHIREDERHGRWMLDDVALPLAEQYPNQAWELVLGYDQEKYMSDRAGVAIVRSIRQIEELN